MDASKYSDSPLLGRGLRTIWALAGNTVAGLSPGEIGRAIGASPSAVTRALAQLVRLGAVEECRTPGRYRLGPAIVQIARAHELEMARARRELDETEQRYSRAAD